MIPLQIVNWFEISACVSEIVNNDNWNHELKFGTIQHLVGAFRKLIK